MSRVHVERACSAEAREMADLLNQIIAIGGTTALLDPLSADDMRGWMKSAGLRGIGFVARDEDGELLGFQWIAPHPELPEGAVDIATFARVGHTGLGIGSALFRATEQAARALGYRWINATIRADNASGLTYYQSRGFETYRHDPDARLPDGRRVGKISKRFDL